MKEILTKYGIDGNGMYSIPLFELQTRGIQDRDGHYKHCMKEIMVSLKNYRTLVVDSLEAMRNEYVVANSPYLLTAINISKDATEKNARSLVMKVPERDYFFNVRPSLII